MSKKDKTPIGIFTESIGLYFSNFSQFIKYMSFPIWGQILGLVLIFATTHFYTQNLPKLIEKFPNLNSSLSIFILTLIITLPGLMIYLKAFWEYLVAYGSINSMLDNMLKSGRVYDFESHTQVVKRRSLTFIGLWMLIGMISIVAICPLFWVICGIFGVYFILAFQVFTFEEDKTSYECLKRSLELVLRHFGSTFLLLSLVGLLTYLFIPQLVVKIFDGVGLSGLFVSWIKPLFNNLPLIEIPNIGVITDSQIATIAFQSLIAQILIQYTLPMRSILWSMWYKELSKNYEPAIKTQKKSRKKRPSEKLMDESHKKYGKRLDSNIIKRAKEKD